MKVHLGVHEGEGQLCGEFPRQGTQVQLYLHLHTGVKTRINMAQNRLKEIK